MTRRILKRLGALLITLLLLFVGFFFWASSGRLSEDALAQTKAYDASPASPAVDTFTVMTYNIGYLSGMTNNDPVERDPSLFENNLETVVEMIREADPDIIGFQEIDFGAERSLNVHQLDTLATRLGYASAAQAVNWDERYLPFPYGAPSVHFGRVLSGQAVLSRYPIRTHERIELARTSRPFWSDAFYLDRLAQVAIVDIGGWPLAVVNVHLEAFEAETRQQQAEEVRALVARMANEGMPVLLIGDFNSVMPAAKSTLPSRLRMQFTDDETMQTIRHGTGLRPALDTEATLLSGANVGTFPADAPNRKIDYIFYTPGRMYPVDAQVQCGPKDAPPSDHCAVTFSFVMPRPEQVVSPPTIDPRNE